MSAPALLEARDLVKHFGGGGFFSDTPPVRAVDGVSLSVREGETFAIVGESGCGKSTLARLLMRLIEPTSGDVTFGGQAVVGVRGSALRDLRRDMQFIFQDPFSSLNPRMSVGRLVGEPIEVHRPDLGRAARRERVARLLTQVGLLPEHMDRYPHEFSGGQRQRIGMARALATGPRLLIGDEPVSALDVSVQAQIINLLGDLGRDLGLTLVIIAHDLAVIRHMSDRVAVMYLGRIVESGPTDDLFHAPRHPYTRALLAAIPVPVPVTGRPARPASVSGEMPSPTAPPPGCRFNPRCPHATDLCRAEVPALYDPDGGEHEVACHHWTSLDPPAAEPAAPARSDETDRRFALYRAASEGARTVHLMPHRQTPKPPTEDPE